MSIKAALEEIGFGPCYHMKIAIYRPHHLKFFMKAWRGEKVNWQRFFNRYNSVVDWPTCNFYKELMIEFPDAKILLNVRDPEAWYDSMFETIWAIQPSFPWWFPPVVKKLHDEIIWNGNFKGIFKDRDKAVAVYQEWVDEVKRTVPADRLLVYNVKEGWEPLSTFLGVPVPEGKAFPHINDKRSFQRVIRLLKVLNWLMPLAVIAGIFWLLVLLADLFFCF
jgi:hypothetical protein